MKKVAFILMALSLLQACATKPVTSGVGSSQIGEHGSWQEHLVVDNTKLGKRLAITNVLTRKTNQLLDINLELSSKYKKTQNLQYHFNWFDKDGFIIEEGKAPWKSLALHGHQIVNLGAIAPNTDVVTFKLYVREVNEEVYRF